MSHQERNSVRAAYIHKAEHLEERQQMMQWWADYLDANASSKVFVRPYRFEAHIAATDREGECDTGIRLPAVRT